MFRAPNSQVTVASHRDDDGTTLVQASADVGLRLEPASGAYSAEPPTGAIGDLGSLLERQRQPAQGGVVHSLGGCDYAVAP